MNSKNSRVFATAAASGVTALAITWLIGFCAFMVTGSSVPDVAAWLIALGCVAFGGTYTGVWTFGMASSGTDSTTAPEQV